MRADVVVIGAGPNGLAAAVVLAAHDLEVMVLEAAEEIGGGARTGALTLPGFLHDRCSAIHPLGIGSPLFRALPLDHYGLEWIHPPLCLAHPFDEDRAAWIGRSLDATAEDLAEDETGYRGLIGPLVERWDASIGAVLGPPLTARGALGLAGWGRGLWPAESVARSAFGGQRARSLFSGVAAHSVAPLDRSPSAGIALVLAAAAHSVGWPLPRGGAGALSRSLGGLFEALGGQIVLGHRVRSLLDVPPARAYVLDLTPRPAARLLAGVLPPRTRRALEGYRYGPGVFKLDWALGEAIPWRDEACRRAGTVHLGGTMPEIAACERAAWEGRPADRPFVIVTQPSRFDPTRAPEGRHTAWAYCHVPHGFAGDRTVQIERQIERFAPGFGDCVLARRVSTAGDLEAQNPNLIGGDVGGGALTVRRIFMGATPRFDPYTTPLPHVFMCSSATPPGGGVHGMCGFHAARSVLRRRFGRAVPADPRRALPRLR